MAEARHGRKKRSVGSLKQELLTKARQAALAAVKTFNDPNLTFKSESFIVLMIIAWTYFHHAYYRSKKIDYRYFELKGHRKKYLRTHDGQIRHWELRTCLQNQNCPLDEGTKQNLLFLIGLRNEIEHRMALDLDRCVGARYQACAANFNNELKKHFGTKYGLDQYAGFALQFSVLDIEQFRMNDADPVLPHNLLSFIKSFDCSVSEELRGDERFAVRLIFTKTLVNHPGQADKCIQFVPADSELAQSMQKVLVANKEVEKPKYRPKEIVAAVRVAGFTTFRIQDHTELWRAMDAKNPKNGFGVMISGTWFWYEKWLNEVLRQLRVDL